MQINKREYIRPSAQLCENYRAFISDPAFILKKLEALAGENFYKAAEIRPFLHKKDRQALSRLASQVPDRELTVWLSAYLRENDLNVSSVDAARRQKAVSALCKLVDEAAESGARNIALYGGNDVGVLQRSAAYEALVTTLGEICERCAGAGMNVFIKPSGRYARTSKKLMALSHDVREVLDIVKKDHPNLYVIFDAAHIALNHEDLGETLEMFGQDISIIRFSNAVLNYDDPRYGDRHIAPGVPGFLTARRAQELLSRAFKLGLGGSRGMQICVPFRQSDSPEPHRINRAFNISTDFIKQTMFEFELTHD